MTLTLLTEWKRSDTKVNMEVMRYTQGYDVSL